jgi:hypothetical protein
MDAILARGPLPAAIRDLPAKLAQARPKAPAPPPPPEERSKWN